MIRSAGDHPDPRRFIEMAGCLATLEGNYWRRSVAVAPVLRSNEPEVLIQAALAGVGIAVVSQTMAAKYLARGLLVPVLPAWQPPPRDVNALYAPGRAQMPKSGRSLIFCWQRCGRICPRSPYRVPTLQVGCATTGARSTITPKHHRHGRRQAEAIYRAMELPLTTSAATMQRLTKIELERKCRQREVAIQANPSALRLRPWPSRAHRARRVVLSRGSRQRLSHVSASRFRLRVRPFAP